MNIKVSLENTAPRNAFRKYIRSTVQTGRKIFRLMKNLSSQNPEYKFISDVEFTFILFMRSATITPYNGFFPVQEIGNCLISDFRKAVLNLTIHKYCE
jgi:hypothetical protein